MGQQIKDFFLREPRKNRVIVCEELDFTWDAPELKEMVSMWNEKVDIREMAEHFERDPDEVLIALIHLAREDKITSERKKKIRKSNSAWRQWEEVAGQHNISMQTFYARLKKGMEPKDAATAPLSKIHSAKGKRKGK